MGLVLNIDPYVFFQLICNDQHQNIVINFYQLIKCHESKKRNGNKN